VGNTDLYEEGDITPNRSRVEVRPREVGPTSERPTSGPDLSITEEPFIKQEVIESQPGPSQPRNTPSRKAGLGGQLKYLKDIRILNYIKWAGLMKRLKIVWKNGWGATKEAPMIIQIMRLAFLA